MKRRSKRDGNVFIINGDICEIILFNDKNEEVARALIDADDYLKVKGFGWYLCQTGYPTNLKTRKRLHHLILDMEGNKYEGADHINGITLDNRKSNLRRASKSQNGANRGKPANNTSRV